MEIEVKLLNPGFRNSEELFEAFKNGKVEEDYPHLFSDSVVTLPSSKPFPIYIAKGSGDDKRQQFVEAFKILRENYINKDRDIHLNGVVWFSFFVTHMRDYIVEKYPESIETHKDFKNIVLKKFDWENYVYRCVLATEYVEDLIEDKAEKQRNYELIIDNLDVFNYLIKYEIFRNGQFVLMVLDIIDELNLSRVMKAKIKGIEGLGPDERYGRRVLLELNQSYPVLMIPAFSKEQLKVEMIKALAKYYDMEKLELESFV